MPESVFVALGSNLGNRERYLETGVSFLEELPATRIVATTEAEETTPLGPEDQGPFLNQMVLVETTLPPEDLLLECKRGEARAGREPSERWGPRTLDLDIVRYGDLHRSTPDLVVPHAELANRPFWLRQLAALIPASWGSGDYNLPEWAQVRAARRGHIERVTALMETWAVARNMPSSERRRWTRAGFLHDALKDAPKDLLAELADHRWNTPSLYHGPAAARYASKHGETDQGVLDAVMYHSIGFAGWDDVGRMLYLADYLEPGRSHRRPHRAELAGRVPRDPKAVLYAVAQERTLWAIRKGMQLPDEGAAFWNSLAE